MVHSSTADGCGRRRHGGGALVGSLLEEVEFEPSVALEQVNLAKEPYGGYKESSIGREFSLEDMLDSFTLPKNVTAPGSGEITCIRL